MFVRLEIETYEEDGKKYVYLSDNGSSGCKYGYNNKDELKNIIKLFTSLIKCVII